MLHISFLAGREGEKEKVERKADGRGWEREEMGVVRVVRELWESEGG